MRTPGPLPAEMAKWLDQNSVRRFHEPVVRGGQPGEARRGLGAEVALLGGLRRLGLRRHGAGGGRVVLHGHAGRGRELGALLLPAHPFGLPGLDQVFGAGLERGVAGDVLQRPHRGGVDLRQHETSRIPGRAGEVAGGGAEAEAVQGGEDEAGI
ncbi:hypothetical protein [Alsobacter sp. SYSU BS001988]